MSDEREGRESEGTLVVVTGMSGAGKTTCLHALSDAGYYCVDNLPPTLAQDTVRVVRAGGIARVALGMDVRVGSFLDAARAAIEALRGESSGLTVLFLDAADDVLVRRFSETRRPHPMLVDDDEHDGVLDGVQLERSQLSAIRSLSTMLVDTSHMTVHGLRRLVLEHFAPAGSMPPMHIRVMSFGFKHGPPRDADVTFDVRFLDNPHFEPELREKTGEEPEVREFVLGSPGCSELLDKLEDLLTFCLPRWEREGKSYLSIALGCTGGRHRSVAIAAELASRLSAETGQGVAIVHRDLARGAMMGAVSATRKVRQPEAEQAGARGGSTHGGPARGGAER